MPFIPKADRIADTDDIQIYLEETSEMDATVDKPIQFEAHEEFDKAKRNVLFWSSALIALLFVPTSGPIELFSLRGFAVPYNFATAAIALITLYHAVGFVIETSRVYRNNKEYRGFKSSMEARLDKLSADLENSVGTVFIRSDQFRIAVSDSANFITNISANLGFTENQIRQLRMEIGQGISYGTYGDPTTIPVENWNKYRKSLADTCDSVLASIDEAQIPRTSNSIDNLKTSIADGNAALGNLDESARKAVESVKQALKKLDRFDRFSFGGFEVAVTYIVVAIGLGTFCYSITDLPDQRGLTTAIFGPADAPRPNGTTSTSR